MASKTKETKFTFTLTLLLYQLQNCSISTPIKILPSDPLNPLNNDNFIF